MEQRNQEEYILNLEKKITTLETTIQILQREINSYKLNNNHTITNDCTDLKTIKHSYSTRESKIRTIINRANVAFEFSRWKEAYTLYKYAEQEGPNGHVYFRLGVLYKNGFNVQRNQNVAKKYFKLALLYLPIGAHLGDPESLCDLGYMYSLQCGVPQDKKKAVKFYRKAAEAGFARGQYNLALSYKNGEGITGSGELAAKYYTLAAAQGDADAQYNLGVMYTDGDGIPKDEELAMHYMYSAAKQGHDYAIYHLGSVHEGKREIEKALEYYLEILHDEDALNRIRDIMTKEKTSAHHYILSKWTKYFHLLPCKTVIFELLLILLNDSTSLPKELIFMIIRSVIAIWPSSPFFINLPTHEKIIVEEIESTSGEEENF